MKGVFDLIVGIALTLFVVSLIGTWIGVFFGFIYVAFKVVLHLFL